MGRFFIFSLLSMIQAGLVTVGAVETQGTLDLSAVVHSSTYASFHWKYTPGNDGTLPGSYLLRYKVRGTNRGKYVRLRSDEISYEKRDFEPEAQYGVRVFAYFPPQSGKTRRIASKWVNIKLLDKMPVASPEPVVDLEENESQPDPPSEVKATISSDVTVVNVTWADNQFNQSPDDTLYTTRYKALDETSDFYRYSVVPFVVIPMSSLRSGQLYTVDIRTTRGNNHSAYSESFNFTTPDESIKTQQEDYDSVRLPSGVKPEHYYVQVAPKVDGAPEDFVNEGMVEITIHCAQDTTVVRLHSLNLNITDISVRGAEVGTMPSMRCEDFWLDRKYEMLAIRVPATLRGEGRYILTISYRGQITSSLKGFYYSPYKDGNTTKYIYTTMMEPTDARRVFPCFDEPEMKAVFEIVIICDNHFTSLSNMPLKTSVDMKNGLRKDIFEPSVLMSTYLVAFAIGEMAFLETNVNGILFRTWSRSNAVELTEYSLNIGSDVMEFFEDYFQIKYPLPKEDMVAIPTLIFNAMEHWGMISYREQAMLYEEGISSASDKEWTSVLVAHELSHQWFGNLVSPKWWDDLWLNEGFATYMMFLAVDSVRPEWKMMNKLAVNYRGIQNVFQVDDVITSHPVYVPVNNPYEINEIFDLISYAKGCSIIRMMNFFLGDGTFRRGLTRYLKMNEYDVAAHNDLWQALQQQSIEDGNDVTDVKSIMDTWLLEKNYPVVMVMRSSNDTLHLSQSAFLISSSERQERSDVFWEVPFVYATDVKNDFENQTPDDIVWLHKSGLNVTLTDPDLAIAKWIIGNPRQVGFYRVNYEEDNWLAIIEQLKTDHSVIHPINRAQIINDAWHLSRAGLLKFDIALSTLEYLGEEEAYTPWVAALRALNSLDSALQLTPAYGNFKLFMQSKLAKVFGISADTHYDQVLRGLISKDACKYGLLACTNEALREFQRWKMDPSYRVNPNIKQSVYCTGVSMGDSDDWELVLDRYTTSSSTSEKNFLLQALACTREPWVVARFVQLSVRLDKLSNIDSIDGLANLGGTPLGRLLAWDLVVANWDFFFKTYGSGLNLFSKLIDGVTKSFNTVPEMQRVQDFMETHDDLGTATRTFRNILSRTSLNIKWMDDHYETVEKWLASDV